MTRRTLRTAAALLVAGCVAGWVTGCGVGHDAGTLSAPVECRAVSIVMGDRGALHERAGLYYELANVSSRAIVSLVVAFDLYDAEPRPYPAQGANRFVIHLDETIDPGKEHSFCTSLDSVVSDRTDVITPARFHVRSVTFADGAIWRNRGFHVCGELS